MWLIALLLFVMHVPLSVYSFANSNILSGIMFTIAGLCFLGALYVLVEGD